MENQRVLILFGGRSVEHEISLLSARNVYLALDRDRFDPVLVAVDKRGRWRQADEGISGGDRGGPSGRLLFQ